MGKSELAANCKTCICNKCKHNHCHYITSKAEPCLNCRACHCYSSHKHKNIECVDYIKSDSEPEIIKHRGWMV